MATVIFVFPLTTPIAAAERLPKDCFFSWGAFENLSPPAKTHASEASGQPAYIAFLFWPFQSRNPAAAAEAAHQSNCDWFDAARSRAVSCWHASPTPPLPPPPNPRHGQLFIDRRRQSIFSPPFPGLILPLPGQNATLFRIRSACVEKAGAIPTTRRYYVHRDGHLRVFIYFTINWTIEIKYLLSTVIKRLNLIKK